MSNCTDCKGSILNTSSSFIGDTKCNGDCPEEMNCADGIYASNCIFYSGANLTCSGISFGDSLSTAFGKLDTLLCESAGCKVKVSSTDACCAYLQDKITEGAGITITKNTVLTCESLAVAIACPEWNNPTLTSKWFNVGGTVQTLQYSTVVGCIVRLRGVVKNNSYTGAYALVTTLPVGYRPLKDRIFPGFTVLDSNSGTTKPANITITTSGQVSVNISSTGNFGQVPIELTFEIN